MRRFEYQTIVLEACYSQLPVAGKYLTKFGEQGWRVIQCTTENGWIVWTLEREIQPETPYRG
jgi:hypothetical protein